MKQIKIISLLSFCLFYLTTIGQTHYVQNLNDSGVGSFRETINLANPDDTIRFDPSLIALGSDTLYIESRININKNLVINGLYDEGSTLYFMIRKDKTMFSVDSVESIVLDSLIIISDTSSIIFPWSVGLFELNNSGCTIDNSRIIKFTNTHIIAKESDLTIIDSRFNMYNPYSSTIIYETEGSEIKSLNLYNTHINANLDQNVSHVFVRTKGDVEKNIINFRNSHFENVLTSVSGNMVMDMKKSSLINSKVEIGSAHIDALVIESKVFFYIRQSTFSSSYLSNSILKLETPSFPTELFLDINNTTFNGGNYDTTSYPYFFGPDLDKLTLEGCIFNDINGFNELPIDSSGGYNLFGFPQSIGLHSTDLQNVSSADIDLGPLQNNGGFTPTHLPSYQSLAFNAGNPNDTSLAQNGTIIQRREIGATEIQALKFTDTAAHCGVDYLWRDSLFIETGRYFEVIQGDTTDLDTVFALSLDISNLQAQAINDWGLLTAKESGAQYQWIDCNTNLPIFGETNQVFEPSIAGNYQVIIDNGICIDTSACMFINNIGNDEFESSPISISINSGSLQFNNTTKQDYNYKIVNVLGQIVDKGNTKKGTKDISNLGKGMYFVEFDTIEISTSIKFVIE